MQWKTSPHSAAKLQSRLLRKQITALEKQFNQSSQEKWLSKSSFSGESSLQALADHMVSNLKCIWNFVDVTISASYMQSENEC